ncbi:MAG: J domain-containing protein [Parvularcula sp.]
MPIVMTKLRQTVHFSRDWRMVGPLFGPKVAWEIVQENEDVPPMFEKTEVRRSKARIMVRICLNDGGTVEGDVFTLPGQRIQDLFNDDRTFIPVEEGGAVTMIAKTAIARASAVGESRPVDGDPYKILRVEATATNAEIREAWMNRLKAAHPDRLAALNLDPEILAAARQASQRINAAYDQIVRSRNKKAA